MQLSSPRLTQLATPIVTASTLPQHSQDSEQINITLDYYIRQKRAVFIDPISSNKEDSLIRIIRLGT
jgi:hypothetical protein